MFFQEGKFRRYDVPDVGEVFKQPGRTNSWTNGAIGHGEEEDGAAAEQNASKVCYVLEACVMVRVGAALVLVSFFLYRRLQNMNSKILHGPKPFTSDPS